LSIKIILVKYNHRDITTKNIKNSLFFKTLILTILFDEISIPATSQGGQMAVNFKNHGYLG